jgi:hypothetical protein
MLAILYQDFFSCQIFQSFINLFSIFHRWRKDGDETHQDANQRKKVQNFDQDFETRREEIHLRNLVTF